MSEILLSGLVFLIKAFMALLPETILLRNMLFGGHQYRISGFANGASQITINGSTADFTDGSFELTAEVKSNLIDYDLQDEFGNHYTGSIDYEEYMDRSGGGACFILSL